MAFPYPSCLKRLSRTGTGGETRGEKSATREKWVTQQDEEAVSLQREDLQQDPSAALSATSAEHRTAYILDSSPNYG